MYRIDKTFQCCYGHRVHNQILKESYSLDNKCVCRHLHGHQMTLKVGLEADNLENGMVTDFKHLNCIKKIVDDVIDHKFIMDINDPLFSDLFSQVDVDLDLIDYKFYKLVNLELFKKQPSHIYEKLEGLVIVDFVPTSENLCKFFADIAKEALEGLLDNRVKLSFVEFWETPKSHCRYEVK